MDCTVHGIREWDMTEQLSCHYTIQNISQLSLVDPHFYSFTHALFFLTSRVLEFLLYSSVFQIPLHYVQYILFEVVFIYSLFLKDISHDIEFQVSNFFSQHFNISFHCLFACLVSEGKRENESCSVKSISLQPQGLIRGILKARILDQIAIPFSRDLPNAGIEPRSTTLQADSLPSEPQLDIILVFVPLYIEHFFFLWLFQAFSLLPPNL